MILNQRGYAAVKSFSIIFQIRRENSMKCMIIYVKLEFLNSTTFVNS
jgi:hypothetical protein